MTRSNEDKEVDTGLEPKDDRIFIILLDGYEIIDARGGYNNQPKEYLLFDLTDGSSRWVPFGLYEKVGNILDNKPCNVLKLMEVA